MKSRKQRKLEAKQNGVAFVPQYNGKGVVGYDDFYGVGNERFNNKFVQFDKSEELMNMNNELKSSEKIREKLGISEEEFMNIVDKLNSVENLGLMPVRNLEKSLRLSKGEVVDVIDSDGLPWKEYEPSTEEKVEESTITLNEDETKNLLKAIEISKPVINEKLKTKNKKESKLKKKIKKLFSK